jgi:hypothetical protein
MGGDYADGGKFKIANYMYSPVSNGTFITINTSGNLGIGTTSPAYKLDVNGVINTNNNMYVSNRLGIATTAPSYALDVVGSARVSGGLYVTSNIGVGTTTPEGQLHLVNSSNHTNIVCHNAVGYNSSLYLRTSSIGGNPSVGLDIFGVGGWCIGNDGGDSAKLKIAADPFNLQVGTKVTIDRGGNVGIGTTTPSYTLDVTGSGRITNGLNVGGYINQFS